MDEQGSKQLLQDATAEVAMASNVYQAALRKMQALKSDPEVMQVARSELEKNNLRLKNEVCPCGHGRSIHTFGSGFCTFSDRTYGIGTVSCHCHYFGESIPVAEPSDKPLLTVEDKRDNRDPLSAEMNDVTLDALYEIRGSNR